MTNKYYLFFISCSLCFLKFNICLEQQNECNVEIKHIMFFDSFVISVCKDTLKKNMKGIFSFLCQPHSWKYATLKRKKNVERIKLSKEIKINNNL